MRWRDIFLHNRWQKAFSLLLAALIWFAVQSGEGLSPGAPGPSQDERTFKAVPIKVLTVAADLGRYQVAPETVEVTVRGDQAVLARVEARDIEAYVNLAEGLIGRQTLAIHVYAPPGAQVSRVAPDQVLVGRLPASGAGP